MSINRRRFLSRASAATAIAAAPEIAFAATPAVTAAEARAIAKDAYVYGFPLVDNYRIEYTSFVDTKNPQFKAPWNHIYNSSHVYTPADTTIQTPNSDTPYSNLGLDLRAEPVVLTIPAMDHNRYFSIQLIDAYTFNFAYIGTRTTGNGGGSFMVAGPRWKGEAPNGISKVIQSDTDFVYALYRTQLFNPGDIDAVKALQAQYKVQQLTAFVGHAPPPAAPAVNWIKPPTSDEERTSLQFFNILNFVLQYCKPTDPSEIALMQRFALINVGAGRNVDENGPDINAALEHGIADAWAEFKGPFMAKVRSGAVTSGDIFGTRKYLKNNYLYRFAAAALGIYGNSKEEAVYPLYSVDADGNPLSGAYSYTMHFAAGDLPPANAFWSLTMYKLPSSLLVANPINRYVLNSPMLPQFKRDADGGLTFYFQHDSPGPDKQSNWLPAPAGRFDVYMRIYWPKPAALNGTWKQPKMVRTAM